MRRTWRSLAVAAFVIVTITAIVGTGFAFWAFSTERRADLKFGVYINEVAVNGRFFGQIPPYAVLEEGGGTSVNGTVTGITFYNVGLFYKDGEGTPLEGDQKVGVLYDTAVELQFKTAQDMTADEAATLVFGMRMTLNGGLLPEFMHTSTWYRTRSKIMDSVSGEEYIDLKTLVSELHPVVSGKKNFEYSPNGDGSWTYYFRFTTTMLNMCFEYNKANIPDKAETYNQMVNRLKNATSAEQSKIVLTLWQGKE